MEIPSPPLSPAVYPQPSLKEICLGFAAMSISGFGGVLVFARRAMVEKHRWLTAEEFNEVWAFSQMLPGPNIGNFSIIVGSRLRGVSGAIAAWLGLFVPPVLLVIAVAAFYKNAGDSELLRRALNGMAIAALGLFTSVVLKMTMPVAQSRSARAVLIAVAVFAAAGIFRLPLLWVIAAALPVSISAAWWVRRSASA